MEKKSQIRADILSRSISVVALAFSLGSFIVSFNKTINEDINYLGVATGITSAAIAFYAIIQVINVLTFNKRMQSMKADLRNDITRDRNDSREYYLSVCFIIQSYASHDNKESFKYLELSLIQLYGMEKRTDEDKKYIADMVSSILVKMAVNNFKISESQRSKVSSLIYKTGLPDYLELLDALSAITVHDKGH